MLALLLLAACSPDPRVLERAEPAIPEGSLWTPEVTVDTGDSGELSTLRTGLACAATLAQDPMSGGGVLDVDYCVRVSPETEEEAGEPDGEGEDAQEDADTEAPPCGFINLIGSARLVGAPDAPALTYCDADLDGAVRFVRPVGEELDVIELAELGCWADLDTAALRPRDEGGWEALWVDLDARASGGDGGPLAGVTLNELGRFEHLPESYDLPSDPWGLELLSRHLLVRDIDRALHMLPWEGDRPGETSVPLAEDVESFTALEDGADLLVATCGASTGALRLLRVEGGVVSELFSAEDACSYDSRPALALTPEGATALAWDDGADGYFVLLDDQGGRVAELELGRGARFPQLTHDGERLVLVDATGAARWLDDQGEEQASAVHPMIAQSAGGPVGLRVLASPELLTVLYVGSDMVPSGTGHLNTFHYVELSQARVP